jgi:Rrf2 family protein
VEISSKNEYAILALIELTTHYASGEPLQIRQIAAQQQIPDRYLEQLLATLRRCGLVRSQRGAKGGYILAREPWKINLFEVLQCLEGAEAQSAEPQVVPKTVESAVIWDVWQEAHQAANAVLQRCTLQDLSEKCNARRQLDIMYYI